MTAPWTGGSMASKTETNHPQLYYNKNLALRILPRSFAAGDSDGMAMDIVSCPVSNVEQIFPFPALESKEDMVLMCDNLCQ